MLEPRGSSCDRLRRMEKTLTSEMVQAKQKLIQVKDVSPETVGHVLKYIYTGEMPVWEKKYGLTPPALGQVRWGEVRVVQVDKNKAAADEAVKQQSFVSMAGGVQFGWAHKFPLDRATVFC